MPDQLILKYHEFIILLIMLLAWAFIHPAIDTWVRRGLTKKREVDFITFERFIQICGENRANCSVIKDFTSKIDIVSKTMDNITRKMDGTVEAMKVVIVHTVTDKEKQEEALRALR